MYQESMISFSYIYNIVQVILGQFVEFIIMLVYGLDLRLYPNPVSLWLSRLQDLFIYYFCQATEGGKEIFVFEQHRLPLFVNCDRQAVLFPMFVLLFCYCFVPFVLLISATNCTLFFSVFANVMFSNFKTIFLCLHVIPLVSFNNSFMVNLQ